MVERILVGIDGSDNARDALDFACRISAQIGGDLTILHVLMHGRSAEEMERLARAEHIVRDSAPQLLPGEASLPMGMREFLAHPEVDRWRAITEIGNHIVAEARDRAEEAGARNVSAMTVNGDYADGILDTAEEIGADLIVIGRRGLGRIRSAILGSVSNKVMQNAECSVLAVHA